MTHTDLLSRLQQDLQGSIDTLTPEQTVLLRKALVEVAGEPLKDYLYDIVIPYLPHSGTDDYQIEDYINDNLIEQVEDEGAWDELFGVLRRKEMNLDSLAELLVEYLHKLYSEGLERFDGEVPIDDFEDFDVETQEVKTAFPNLVRDIQALLHLKMTEHTTSQEPRTRFQ